MARSGVTFAEVEEVARYLQGLGRYPTVDAIRNGCSTGSRTTLAEHLSVGNQCKQMVRVIYHNLCWLW